MLPRNHLALVARQRNGGPMRDRRAPRGGVRNTQADYMDEYADELEDLKDDPEHARVLNWIPTDEK